MNPATSTRLHFAMTSDEALDRAVVELTRVFHVVPAAMPDLELPMLSVEVDADYPELVDEVREIVKECNGVSAQLTEAV